MQEADRAFVLPAVSEPCYADRLFELCGSQQVRLLVPLNDLELPLLAKMRDELRRIGTVAVISSEQVIETCFDKWATFMALKQRDTQTARTYLSLEQARSALERGEVGFPLVVKPRWGTASIGIEYAEDLNELEWSYQLLRRRIQRTIVWQVSARDAERSLLIQERLGGQEYGLDVVNDLQGQYVTTFARRKLRMRAGETDRALTLADDQLAALGERLGRSIGHVGNLDCDVMVDGGRVSVLEMNPRFGGGYPFSHHAGADLPSVLLAWADGRQPDARWLTIRPDVIAAKCDRLVAVHVPAVKQAARSAGGVGVDHEVAGR
jgi:carbamoyl-phosphate synthase large subunit